MLSGLGNERRIFLATMAVDMRKSFDGLSTVVRSGLCEDPLRGDMFVFLNRLRTMVKVLVWDRSGFWVYAKRLESGKFSRPWVSSAEGGNARVELSAAELQVLLEGINIHHATYHQHYRHGK